MTYDDVVAALMTLNEIPFNQTDENFQRILPTMFLDAEARCYTDLLFLATRITQPLTLTARNRELVLPPSVRTVDTVNVITPVQTGGISLYGKRNPLERIPSEVLNFFQPDASFRMGPPQKYAVVGIGVGAVTPPAPGTSPPFLSFQHVMRFMPTPDQAYTVEVLGDVRPQTLSEDNPQTYLSIFFPELFIAACMVFAAGYQRDFSSQADDPQRAMSWEAHYAAVKQGAMLEAARMRGEGPGYTAEVPAPVTQGAR